MLELYHSINSVCAQKVRIALEEKGQEAKDHIMTLRGDQYEPAYLKLNPNGVVPTLIHDGEPITESSLILYYIDDAFPEPPLMPKQPRPAPPRAHVQQADRRICAQLLHDPHIRNGIPPGFPARCRQRPGKPKSTRRRSSAAPSTSAASSSTGLTPSSWPRRWRITENCCRGWRTR